VARNTVTIRCNYLRDESIPFYVKSVALYEVLTRELKYNLMYSKRSMIDVIQTYPMLRQITRRMLNIDTYGATYEKIGVDELRRANGDIRGVETNRGVVRANKVAVAVSGHTTTLTEAVGLRLPLKSFNLTAFVSEPVKPLIEVIVNCPDIGVYLSQSDKGELVIGGRPDPGQSFRRDIK
jgi:hypothetical protein